MGQAGVREGLRRLVLSDLARAQRLIARVNDEIDPQFRIASPEGDIHIAMSLGEEEAERSRRFGLLSDFMALKTSPAFVMAAELKEPDAVFAAGFTLKESAVALSLIERDPLVFGPVEWLREADVGDDLPGLLPRGERVLSAARLRQIEEWFGPTGKFPAVLLGSGRALTER